MNSVLKNIMWHNSFYALFGGACRCQINGYLLFLLTNVRQIYVLALYAGPCLCTSFINIVFLCCRRSEQHNWCDCLHLGCAGGHFSEEG